MDVKNIKENMIVRSSNTLGPSDIYNSVATDIVKNRTEGKLGKVLGAVPGYGGEVFWVRQQKGVAVYLFTELEAFRP